MIHLHSMFSSETNLSASGKSSSAPLSKTTLDSFHGALSDAVSSTLEKFGIHPNDVKISITRASQAASSSESTTSDRPIVTRSLPGVNANSGASSSSGASSTTGTSTSSAAPDDGYNPFLQASYSNPYPASSATSASSSAANSSAATESTSSTEDPQQAFDNAYWASQPAAVQALQNIQNPEQRASMATQLANEGYSIDVPIMVWGWDPSITTAMRQADGYTWVPSALQNPVEDAPGLPAVGTIAAYDPNNAPAGSIAV
jgi:hypothetical protein